MKNFAVLSALVISFLVGALWQKWSLLESGSVELTKALALQVSPESLGKLPAGTILYPYSSFGGVTTFVVFVNTKNMDALKPHQFENAFTVAPVDGYVDVE